MRFSVIAATLFASAVMAESTIYKTEEITITSCAPTVTDCPARSTVVSVTSYPVVSSAPVYHNSSAAAPATTSTPVKVASSAAGVVPTFPISVITISTCVPTVIYSTVTITPTKAAPVTTGSIAPPKNATSPTTPAAPSQFTGAASSVQGSVAVAAVAGLAAFLFA